MMTTPDAEQQLSELSPEALATLERIRAKAREMRQQYARKKASRPVATKPATIRKSRTVQTEPADLCHRGLKLND